MDIPSTEECAKYPELNKLYEDKKWNKYLINEDLLNDVDAVIFKLSGIFTLI